MAPVECPDGPENAHRRGYPSAMHAKTIPPTSDQAHPTDDAVDEADRVSGRRGGGGRSRPDGPGRAGRDDPPRLPARRARRRRWYRRRGCHRGLCSGHRQRLVVCAAAHPDRGRGTPATEAPAEEVRATETTEPSPRSRAPAEPMPEGWTEHDMAAREKVRRFVGNLAADAGHGRATSGARRRTPSTSSSSTATSRSSRPSTATGRSSR